MWVFKPMGLGHPHPPTLTRAQLPDLQERGPPGPSKSDWSRALIRSRGFSKAHRGCELLPSASSQLALVEVPWCWGCIRENRISLNPTLSIPFYMSQGTILQCMLGRCLHQPNLTGTNTVALSSAVGLTLV